MMNSAPFIVYALDTPAFPSGEMWPYDPFAPRNRARYGCQSQELQGSLMILSGGYLYQNDKTEGSSSIQAEMWLDGCLGMRDRLGESFAERAIAEILDPDARVTMVLYISRDEAADHLVALRQAGFEVIVTGDVTPGIASNFAVCLGTAKMLRTHEWLSQVWPHEPFFFHTNKGSQSVIEKAVIDAATNKTNPEAAAIGLLKEVEQAPDTAERILGEHYVRVSLTDPEMKSLLIMRNDPDVSDIERLFHSITKGVGIGLYDAGSLRMPDSESRFFTQFPWWDCEMPVPERWRRIL